jgi:hypothetical protein
MALPKLTIKLFPPKKLGTSYSASGNLILPIGDVHAFAEWLLGQGGEYDDYLNDNVVRLLAFEYHNASKGGNPYRTVQLKDPSDLAGNGSQGLAPRPAYTVGSGFQGNPSPCADDDIPF